MKVTHILKAALLLLLGGIMSSCEEDLSANSPIHFIVYGTVYDSRTGDPVNSVEVTLYYGTHVSGLGSSNPHGAAGSSVSGSDGQFRIPCIATDNLIRENNHWYQIEAFRSGYNNKYSKDLTIIETEGAEIQMDILLE